MDPLIYVYIYLGLSAIVAAIITIRDLQAGRLCGLVNVLCCWTLLVIMWEARLADDVYYTVCGAQVDDDEC